jgi:hypothetical protein
MITPEKKARELFNKFYFTDYYSTDNMSKEVARKCSVIYINYILDGHSQTDFTREFWNEVKAEIEKYEPKRCKTAGTSRQMAK